MCIGVVRNRRDLHVETYTLPGAARRLPRPLSDHQGWLQHVQKPRPIRPPLKGKQKDIVQTHVILNKFPCFVIFVC